MNEELVERDQEPETIGMLLDIEHLYGEHEGRSGPWLIWLAISGFPILLYIYLGLYLVFPVWAFTVIMIYVSLRAFMKLVGRENYRVELYKKQLNDDYMSTADMLNIKTIHPDGCIEYLNGVITYLVCCFNGTTDSEIRRSVQLRKFLEIMIQDYEFDTYIVNINDSPALRNYYNKVNNFDKNTSAMNFINIIDHSIKLTEDSSMVQCTLYAIRGYRSDWKDIRNQIDVALNSRVARCYKTLYRVSDPESINEILNRNSDSVINIQDLLRHKYSTHQYATSKVLAYDLADNKEIIQGKAAIKPVVNDEAPNDSSSFHKHFEEDYN